MEPLLNVIIFSKDRACQLDSLLRSLHDNFSPFPSSISILYHATSPEFLAAYDKLKQRPYAGTVTWNPQQDFHTDLNRMLGTISDGSYLMFLVDDDIFFRPIDAVPLLAAFGKEHLFISLRCSRTYAKDPLPDFSQTSEMLEWRWNCQKGSFTCWNYPFSLDGNIFHVSHMKRIAKSIDFSAPNSFEGRMHTYRHHWWVKRIRLALAPPEACIFNNPLNKVQNESETRHAGISAEELNARYLHGEQIDNTIYSQHTPAAEHDVVELAFQSIS